MKKLLPLLFIFIGFSVSAQVGIGTDMPNPSSQLEIVANDKGLLIPQVALLNLTDESTITNGNVESLLVFNTSANQSMSPGYYYWYNGSWKRIATSNDPSSNIPDNIVIWNAENQEFVYLDQEGDRISINLDEIVNESITKLVDNLDGTYTYTSEDDTITTINVPADVISNIDNNGDIYERIIELITSNSYISNITDNGDGTFNFTDSQGNTTEFDANTTSLVDNADGTYDLTNANGSTININTNADSNSYDNTNSGLAAGNVQDALDEIQQNLEDTNADLGNIDLTDNGDGTFTYTDAEGNIIDFDANTTSYTENGGGSYTFTNDNGESITVTVVDDVVSNIQNQGAIYDEILSIIGSESDILVDNNDGTYTHTAVDGTEVIIDANTTSVSVTDGVYTFTNGNGDVITTIDTNASASGYDNTNSGLTSTNVQDALDEIQQNLEDTNADLGNIDLTDNGDGTFTYTDAEGNIIDFDANTTSYTENGGGSYTFTNDNGESITVTVVDDVVSNIQNQGAIYDEILSIIGSESDILVDNNDGTYTHTAVDGTEVIIDANTTSVSVTDGVYTFTNGNGDVITTIDTNASASGYDNTNSGLTSTNVQDALDEIQQNLEDTNADLGNIDLTDNGDGTFTYTDAEGNIIDFDANTTSYTENGGGSYTFTNDNGESITVTVVDDVVSNIQNQGAIYDEILSIIGSESDILVDNNNGTYTHTAVDGTEVIIDANTTSVSVTDGVYTFTDASGNTITTIDTNASASGYDNTNSGLTSTNVQDALDEIQQNLEDTNADLGNIDLTDNGDGTFTYTDAEGNIIDFDANTTSYTENGGGSYTFTNDNGESITVTVVDDVVSNIQNQGAIYNEILSIIGNESDILVDNNNGTYTHTAVDGTEVIIDANTTSVSVTDGVYTFTNGNGDVITTIDTNASASGYDNTNSGLAAGNVQEALDEIQSNLDNTTDVLVANGNGTYTHTAVDGTEVIIDANTTSVSVADGVYTFTNGNGDVITTIDTNASASGYDNTNSGLASTNVQDALDEIQSNLDNTTDVLVDNGNGTYTHTAVDGTEVIIDANTTSVSVTDGVYTFTNGNGDVITTIDTNASASGYDNTNSGLTSTNVQDALDEIQSNLDNTTDVLVANGNGTYTHTAVDGTAVIIDANTTSVSVTDGVYTFTDASGNTITTIDTNASAVSFDNTTNILTATNVQTAIEELLATVNTGEGDLSLDGGLEFISGTDGLSKLLADAGIQVADAGISTAKLADGAVTTNKIQGVGNDQIMATDATGNVTWIDKSGVGEILEAKNGLTKSALDIKLGGALIEPTSITTDATNTLAVAGLQPGTANDQLVVAEADGTLRKVKSAMPKFFYMPSVVFDTSTQGTSFTRNLHQEYVNQFGSPMVSSAGASAAIPTLPANELEYHITYYDTTVFANVSVDGNGVLTYDIISSTNSAASFMNIVFVVK